MLGKSILEKQPHLMPVMIAAIMLLLALAPFPYGYYKLLRLFVCGAALYVAFASFNLQKIWAVWVFGFVAILFNPLIPIHLSREIWQPIDVICSILFIVMVFVLEKPIEYVQDISCAIKVNSIQEEYEYLSQQLCSCGGIYNCDAQSLLSINDIYYDELEVSCVKCGRKEKFLFNINSFHPMVSSKILYESVKSSKMKM